MLKKKTFLTGDIGGNKFLLVLSHSIQILFVYVCRKRVTDILETQAPLTFPLHWHLEKFRMKVVEGCIIPFLTETG